MSTLEVRVVSFKSCVECGRIIPMGRAARCAEHESRYQKARQVGASVTPRKRGCYCAIRSGLAVCARTAAVATPSRSTIASASVTAIRCFVGPSFWCWSVVTATSSAITVETRAHPRNSSTATAARRPGCARQPPTGTGWRTRSRRRGATTGPSCLEHAKRRTTHDRPNQRPEKTRLQLD